MSGCATTTTAATSMTVMIAVLAMTASLATSPGEYPMTSKLKRLNPTALPNTMTFSPRALSKSLVPWAAQERCRRLIPTRG
ncbi:hypothetical protein GGR55DRAFT_671472 [Xylaria sp. FL0064]|nr:hypothetical protein GGR55DRAFT_671472 [Xylaria sp. FL0064]